jgi:teichuronic acid biosynthesis glycosyltransferase TuaC
MPHGGIEGGLALSEKNRILCAVAGAAGYERAVLRVLVLSSAFPDAGRPRLGCAVEQQALALAARAGVEVRVVAPLSLAPFPFSLLPGRRHRAARRGLPRHEIWKGLGVYRPIYFRIPGLPLLAAPALARSVLPLVARIRTDFPFDVISAEYAWPDGPAAMRLAAALDVPFSVKSRGGDFPGPDGNAAVGRQVLAAAQKADGLLAVSKALRDKMAAAGMPPDRIAVHYTGVDRALFHPRERAEAKAALGVEGPLLLIAGNLVPRKAQKLAVEAMRHLDGATLIIAGDGPDGEELRARIKELGLQDRVRMPGSLPQEELAHLYSAADATILASTGEGLATAWVESLACGTPVVASDVTGAREALTGAAAGRIVARDPHAIAGAVRELLADPPLREDVVAASRKFSWERNAEQLEAHLRAMVR